MPDGQGDVAEFGPVVMPRVDGAKTGIVICVIDPTGCNTDCKADRVTLIGTPFPRVVPDELTWLESVTGLPGFVELPVTDTSRILPRLAVAGTP